MGSDSFLFTALHAKQGKQGFNTFDFLVDFARIFAVEHKEVLGVNVSFCLGRDIAWNQTRS